MPTLHPPPGPIGLPLIGVLPRFRKDPAGYMLATAREFGDISYFRLGRRRIYLVERPDLIEEVLVHNAGAYRKSKILQLARIVLGDGLLTAEGEQHLRHRKMIQPAFYRERLQAYSQVMTACSVRAADRWREAQEMDIAAEMQRLTLAITGFTLFNRDVEGEAADIGAALTDVLSTFDTMLLPGAAFLQRFSPAPRVRKAARARAELNAIVHRLIAERRVQPSDSGDLLSMLIEASDEANGQLSDTEVRDEVMTLLLAGHETTAVALTWTWYLLSQNPSVEARLHAEIRTVLGDRDPGWDDIQHLEYTGRVLSESMRLFPPAWAIARENRREVRLFNSIIPPRSIIVLSPWVTHRNPRFWPDPERFDPDRFLPEFEEKRPKFAYFPFGGGPRQCIGDRFARMEATLVLATIARRWCFRVVPGHPVATRAGLTLRPRYGMKMRAGRVLA